MMKYMYWGTCDNDLVDNFELSKMIRIVTGENVSDFEKLKEIAKRFPGITGEIKYPSVERLVSYGYKSKAIKVLYRSKPDLSLVECKKMVDEMDERLKMEKL